MFRIEKGLHGFGLKGDFPFHLKIVDIYLWNELMKWP